MDDAVGDSGGDAAQRQVGMRRRAERIADDEEGDVRLLGAREDLLSALLHQIPIGKDHIAPVESDVRIYRYDHSEDDDDDDKGPGGRRKGR